MLSDALQTGCDCIVTGGGSASNQICAVAACGAKLGLKTHVIYPETTPAATRRLCQMLQAVPHIINSAKDIDLGIRRVCTELRSKGKKPYQILQGAPGALGLLGYMDAMREIAAQASLQGFQVDHIVCCGGTGNTYAGLLMGCKLFSPATKATVVSIGRRFTHPETLIRRISQAAERAGLTVPVDTSDIHTYFCAGKGHGIPSPKGLSAMETLAAAEGVFLDPHYTGKAFAGLLELNENGYFGPNENIVFVHTGGMNSLLGFLQKGE